MWSVGLDVHPRSSTMCILDENGKRAKQQRVRGSWQKVIEFLEQLSHPFAICYEASCGYGALHDRLCRLAKRVVVAHPGHLRLIFRAKRKNDRCDALAVRLGVPAIKAPRGLAPPSQTPCLAHQRNAHRVVGVIWRRGESNPRPVTIQVKFLRA